MRSAYYNTDEIWSTEFDFLGPAFEKPELYERWNPALFVSKWKTPTLVIHSELDYRCPINEGIETFTALQRRGITSRFLYFKDEGHWVIKRANTIRWMNEILEWLDLWTVQDKQAKSWDQKKISFQ